MTKLHPDQAADDNRLTSNIQTPRHYSSKRNQRHNIITLPILFSSCYSPKFSLYILSTCVTLFILFQIQSLYTQSSSSSSSPASLSFLMQQWQKVIHIPCNCTTTTTQLALINSMAQKLRQSVTFLPLQDLRFTDKALQGHTWFMSSMYDTHEEGEVQYQQFPSEISQSRLLCLKGRDTHDGSWNYYALAYPEMLPFNATLMKGLTFVSYNHYNYNNIWHGLSALAPFVAWHIRNQCTPPSRWVLYHWGELRFNMGPWLRTLTEATFGEDPRIEGFDGINNDDQPVCFEKAVVMRHNEGGMSRERRMEVYDFMRCKARMYCNVSSEKGSVPLIVMTLFMRTGPRSFRNESAVIKIFERECQKVEGCRLMVAYSNNLTVCEQLKNFVFHWIASWSGMKHQGAWRDPDGDNCPYPEDDLRCMSVYKNGRIGCNETYFAEWARRVLIEVKTRKLEEEASQNSASVIGCHCS